MARGVTIQGEFGALRAFRLAVRDVARPASRRLVLADVGRTALAELRKGFSAQRSPDGDAWPATTDGRAALGGSMASSWSFSVAGRSVRLVSFHRGARTHQRGMTIRPKGPAGVLVFQIGGRTVFARKVKIPRRRMTPRNGSLGAWTGPVETTASQSLGELVRRKLRAR